MRVRLPCPLTYFSPAPCLSWSKWFQFQRTSMNLIPSFQRGLVTLSPTQITQNRKGSRGRGVRSPEKHQGSSSGLGGFFGHGPLANSRLMEVITIYEKLTKSRDKDQEDENLSYVFQPTSNYFRYYPYPGEEDALMKDVTAVDKGVADDEESANVLDFNKFRNILPQNYSYFSSKRGLVQGPTLDAIRKSNGNGFCKAEKGECPPEQDLLLNSKHYLFNMVNPTEDDLAFLGSKFHVHELTLRDIRDQSTEEKVEIFKHYTFLSLKPYNLKNDKSNEFDLNILLFPDSAIIIHYSQNHWTGFQDVLGFLNLLSSYGATELTPDWVLFSIFIELTQDAKFSVKDLESKILSLKIADVESAIREDSQNPNTSMSKDQSKKVTKELSTVLTKNFENEFEIYQLRRFLKPKIKVLKVIRGSTSTTRQYTGPRPLVMELLSKTRKEFEELLEELQNFSHILERTQDVCLTLANVRQSEESNQMGNSMKKISEVALFFLPLQALAGFLGMNVKIPFQEWPNTLPFWGIIMSSSFLIIVFYKFSRAASAKVFKNRGPISATRNNLTQYSFKKPKH